ncbi:hypothetical protein NQ318_006903 [Aromia moschata]|uniref:Uncharacterized protein n=1 Tax=Aromia moschata TaxID=1265417 RepID=A0AAV8XN61_9CUCU|nr:hypothetical protein NQ318_006903 [Aromia moschata]
MLRNAIIEPLISEMLDDNPDKFSNLEITFQQHGAPAHYYGAIFFCGGILNLRFALQNLAVLTFYNNELWNNLGQFQLAHLNTYDKSLAIVCELCELKPMLIVPPQNIHSNSPVSLRILGTVSSGASVTHLGSIVVAPKFEFQTDASARHSHTT